jgi:hypothetical protein
MSEFEESLLHVSGICHLELSPYGSHRIGGTTVPMQRVSDCNQPLPAVKKVSSGTGKQLWIDLAVHVVHHGVFQCGTGQLASLAERAICPRLTRHRDSPRYLPHATRRARTCARLSPQCATGVLSCGPLLLQIVVSVFPIVDADRTDVEVVVVGGSRIVQAGGRRRATIDEPGAASWLTERPSCTSAASSP